MSRCGDMYENRVTGEYAVVLRGSEERPDGPGLVHLIAQPGSAVVGEHIHRGITERFKVISGTLAAKIGGEEIRLSADEEAIAPPGKPHDWWNPSKTEAAHVLVELTGDRGEGERFELLIGTLFGLANDGKVNGKGRPNPLQAAVIADEFADVIRFTKPPAAVQRVLIGILAPLGRVAGYRGTYPAYAHPHGHVDPDPQALRAAGLTGCTD
ncbi:hypothetical protein BH24ACT7_BH24ACT7_15960 [soil metagenome]